MARHLYTLFFIIFLPAMVLRLLWRSLKQSAYRQRIGERFAIFKRPALAQQPIWVHAVSVGEVIAAVPLVKRLQVQYPKTPIVVTTMTPTGSERVLRLLGEQVFHVYLPYDLPILHRRFLAKIKPRALLVMETELWPNMIAICAKKDVPVALVNGRLSEKSAAGYQRVRLLTLPMLNQLAVILAQDEATRARFEGLGMPTEKLQVTGSIKFDLDIPTEQIEQGRALKQESFANDYVIVAASTHDGEDEIILRAFERFRARHEHARLILVPRHPERFDKVAHLANKNVDNNMVRRSQLNESTMDWDILVGDSMGEMIWYFSLADVVIMGGTLIDRGGHNFLEPAALALPIISGSSYFNFQDIAENMLANNALSIVEDSSQLYQQLEVFWQLPKIAAAQGEQGAALVESNKGALTKTLDQLAALIEK